MAKPIPGEQVLQGTLDLLKYDRLTAAEPRALGQERASWNCFAGAAGLVLAAES